VRRLRDETIAYHAARILLDIRHVGSPQRSFARLPGLRGRTLLAKVDFFIRYPTYLAKAAAIRSSQLGIRVDMPPMGAEAHSVESHMVRYLYGPWDDVYFNVLAYLVGKRLIRVEVDRGVEIFRLTAGGFEAANRLSATADYAPLARRAVTVAALFPRFGGTALKEFIYTNFPEVISRKLGATI
jgi:hypothetical protein